MKTPASAREPSSLRRFDQKVALVVGAGSVGDDYSNGMATAIQLAGEGATVFAIDRNEAANERTRSEIAAVGGMCETFIADVTSASQVQDSVDACIAKYGRIDVVFNNVGMQVVGGPCELEEGQWDAVMATNIKSVFLVCRAVLPHMTAQKSGVIINNSSITSKLFTIPNAVYAASKGAINAFTRNVAVQYAPRGIRANAILPGLIATPRITNRLKEAYGDDAASRLNERASYVPMGHMGDPWDVAKAVTFLASDDAKYITGIELTIDGGLCASGIGRGWED